MFKQVILLFTLVSIFVQQSVIARNGVRILYAPDDILLEEENSQEQDFSDWYAGYKMQQAAQAPQIVAIVQRPTSEKISSDRDRIDQNGKKDKPDRKNRDHKKNRDTNRDPDLDSDDDVDRRGDDYRRDHYKDNDFVRYYEDDDRIRYGGSGGGGGCCDSGFDFTILLALISVGLLYILFLYLTVNTVGKKRKRSISLSNDISEGESMEVCFNKITFSIILRNL